MFYFLMLIGFFIRLLLIPFSGFKADIAFWKGWGLAVADKGILWLAENTNYNYPPGFAYVLFLINKIYKLFADPYNIESYWSDGNLLYLFLFKIIFIAADIGIVYLLIKISKLITQKKKNNQKISKWVLFLPLFYFLNPASFFDGAHWGQVDQFGLLLFLLVIFFLIKEKITEASVIFSLSYMMKFQNIIFIPLFYLFVWKKYSLAKMIDSLKWSALTLLIINLPFLISKRADLLIKLLTINNNYFPFYSLYAFNFWWILSGLDGMKIYDTNLIFGITTARNFSVMLFSFFYALVVLLIIKSKKENLMKNFLLSATALVFFFFHLLTQSHERYLYHVLGLLPLLFLFYLQDDKYKDRRLFIFYWLVSAVFFLNLYLTMFFNYPDQVLWFFDQQQTRLFTLYLSYLNIGLFGYFLVKFFLPEIIDEKIYLTGLIIIFFTGLIYKNLDYILKKPIYLTSIPPYSFSQDYMTPTYNKNLNSFLNPFNFGRISSNYYFYKQAIASHTNSAIIYNLGGKFSRFKSDFGIETEADANAEAFFIVEADGRQIFRSEKKGHFDKPSTVDLKIDNVKQLVLKIQRVGSSNYGHHADWLNPVLISY
ncbi:MAG: NPCBM/NEW2 domain-containing protein [Microgenomates group bacterium]|nr:NPCBM/NEW2 domain-containing protein [Microgenomates group bacterium]